MTVPKGAKTSSPLTGKSKILAGSSIRIGSTANMTFSMPVGITLPQFDGMGWANWSGILEVLLVLHEAEDVFLIDECPNCYRYLHRVTVNSRRRAKSR